MQVEFLKDEKIAFDGINISLVKKGDLIEKNLLDKISKNLFQNFLDNKIIKLNDDDLKLVSEAEVFNPVEETQDINPVEETKKNHINNRKNK